jgi:hypothetical protein
VVKGGKELETKKLYGTAELGKLLGWSTEKTSVYYNRNKFITPAYKVGKRPLWTKEQIEIIVNKLRGSN